MKHAIIVAHPDPNSFTMAMASRYAQVVSTLGHAAVTRDLYRMQFQPNLQFAEMPDRPIWSISPDAEAERAVIHEADVFAFVYPLWFNAPPSIVSGYVERVFGAGFGYEQARTGGLRPLLTGRQLITVTASGASSDWLHAQGDWRPPDCMFADYMNRVCGLRVREGIHFESVVHTLPGGWAQANLRMLEARLVEYFPAPAPAPQVRTH